MNTTPLANDLYRWLRFHIDGRCAPGWVRLTIRGERGARVQLRHAEELTHPPYGVADGSIDMDGLTPTANQTDVFILKGDPAGETFEPCEQPAILLPLLLTSRPLALAVLSLAAVLCQMAF